MSANFNALWVSGSPSLKCLNMPVLVYLNQFKSIARWEYFQTIDEPASIEIAVNLLHQFLKTNHPVHLIGHGIGGTIALMFARQYPQYVHSLTLLAVAAQPANTWHTYYYKQRQCFNLNRTQVLLNTVHNLFRDRLPCHPHRLINGLNKDLENLPLMHSLYQRENLPQGGVSIPLMVCGSKTDPIVSYPELHEWEKWLKPQDVLWECPQGGHFFHCFYPDKVGAKISNFWQNQDYI
ncbi:MAG: alpha/beta hydrolase [Calothrix sp. C42_A2020_038]|nr:alpha/beta hydrolase [Calothrix sp. C42_A2020_038]